MELGGSALDGVVELTAVTRAVFGSVVGNQQFHFTDGIYTGSDGTVLDAGYGAVTVVLADDTVQCDHNRPHLSAVDGRSIAAPSARVVVTEILNARQRFQETKEVATTNRRVDNLCEIDVLRTVRAIRGNVRHFGLNLDRRGHVANREPDSGNRDPLLGADRQILLFEGLKAGMHDLQAVDARNEADKLEVAIVVGFVFARLLRDFVR